MQHNASHKSYKQNGTNQGILDQTLESDPNWRSLPSLQTLGLKSLSSATLPLNPLEAPRGRLQGPTQNPLNFQLQEWTQTDSHTLNQDLSFAEGCSTSSFGAAAYP